MKMLINEACFLVIWKLHVLSIVTKLGNFCSIVVLYVPPTLTFPPQILRVFMCFIWSSIVSLKGINRFVFFPEI
jgi:hypothetical protein